MTRERSTGSVRMRAPPSSSRTVACPTQTMRSGRALTGHAPGNGRAVAGLGLDIDDTSCGGDPVGEVREARPAVVVGDVEPRPVVADLEPHQAVVPAHAHGYRRGSLPVLCGVLHRLRAHEVDGALDLRPQTA